MRIILLERIRNLGFMGDVVEVKPGFARNFLLPRKKALRATEENIKVFESRKKVLEAENLKYRQEAENLRDKVQGMYFCLERNAAESGQLYGSIHDRDVVDAAGLKGLKIERKQVILNTPIKQVGVYKVVISLHPEVDLEVLVAVAASSSAAEALIQETLHPKEEIKAEANATPTKKSKKTEASSEA